MAAPLIILIAGVAYKVAKPLYTQFMKKGIGKAISKVPSGKKLKTMTKKKASDLLGGTKVTPTSMSQKGVKKVTKNIAAGAGATGAVAGYLIGKNRDKIKKSVSGKSEAKTPKKLKGVKPKIKPSAPPKKKDTTPRLSRVLKNPKNPRSDMVLPDKEVSGSVTINWDEIKKLDKNKASGGYVKKYANGGRVAKYNKD